MQSYADHCTGCDYYLIGGQEHYFGDCFLGKGAYASEKCFPKKAPKPGEPGILKVKVQVVEVLKSSKTCRVEMPDGSIAVVPLECVEGVKQR